MHRIYLLFSLFFLFLSCSSYMVRNEKICQKNREELESKVWILRNDIKYFDGSVLYKNTKVRLVIVNDSDVLKVYCYEIGGRLVDKRLYLLFGIYKKDIPNYDKVSDEEIMKMVKKRVLEYLKEG